MKTDSYIQWYNENEGRAYPIREEATRRTITGLILPNDLIVDANVMVPPVYTDLYFSSIRVTPSTISVGISCASGGLLIGTFPRTTYRPYVAMALTSIVEDATGWIVLGKHQATDLEDYRFNGYLQSGLETRVIRIVDRLPVRSLIRLGGNPLDYLGGVIRVVAGAGIRVEKDPGDPQKIIVKLTPEAAQAMSGPCNESASEDACGVPPLRSINGVCPDANGKITLRFE